MNADNVTSSREGAGASPQLPRPRLRLPLAKPRATYVLLGLLVIVFVAETVLGGSTDSAVLLKLGAQANSLVAGGELWRLLAAMFLHIGLYHIGFNGWALFSLGRDIEAFYGIFWFLVIYLASGLFGNVAYYVLGPDGLSAGASGAVFGLIGAEVAYFLCNRTLFGVFGRQRLVNLAGLIGINLVFGFTVPGINNIAHLGGLLSGMLLGLLIAPRYRAELAFTGGVATPALVDRRSIGVRILAVVLAVALLIAGIWAGNAHWAGSASLLQQRAQAAYDAGDLPQAARLLEQARAAEPGNAAILYNLAIVYIQQGELAQGAEALESSLAVNPSDTTTMFVLALAYGDLDRPREARSMLEAFLAREPTGERADYARQMLAGLQ